MNGATYLIVSAAVRYWEDATVNGVEDQLGNLIPLRSGDCWCPTIRIADGKVMNWPSGTTADIHYKVCDQGEYWLADESQQKLAKYSSDYVPDALAPAGGGYGDYIILHIGADGVIQVWRNPEIDPERWGPMPGAACPHCAGTGKVPS